MIRKILQIISRGFLYYRDNGYKFLSINNSIIHYNFQYFDGN